MKGIGLFELKLKNRYKSIRRQDGNRRFDFLMNVAKNHDYELNGGDRGIRTPGLLRAKQALSQLSYIPMCVRRIVESLRLTR